MMFEYKNITCLICVIILSTVTAIAQKPFAYWTFDGKDMLLDQVGAKPINSNGLQSLRVEKGVVGNAIISPSGAFVATNVLRSAKPMNELTLEFAFKGNELIFEAAHDLYIQYGYNGFFIMTSILRNGKIESESWRVPLKGIGVNSYSGLANKEWHHFVFIASSDGTCQIWIDGTSVPAFRKSIKPFSSFSIKGLDGFRLNAAVDEVAFYDVALSEPLIKQHAAQIQNKQGYTFSLQRPAKTGSLKTSSVKTSKVLSAPSAEEVDVKEFAPGYPAYTVQATDQLKYFPNPRFSPKVEKRRNFSWLDITYLHRELPGAGGKGFGKQDPAKAVELMKELVSRWNYYFELPTMRMDSLAAKRKYEDPGSVEHALIRYAKANSSIPTSSVIMQIQGNPAHAGFESKRPPQIAQDLDPEYYLRDEKGEVILHSGKKWLSPLAPLDRTVIDAKTTASYLRQLSLQLGRPIDFLNENGELFGHMRSSALLGKDPRVKKDMERRGLTIQEYNGRFQNKLDTCYKNEILRNLGWDKTLFTFYEVSAYNDTYWPSYKMRRTSNFVIDGNHFSTPAFYPALPDNWRQALGPLNGYGKVAEGRLKEIALGDKLFAPFVSAGWSFEEDNIRPAQWLALLKSMVMLGADFFHVGYFNVTGSGGKWPNGEGPNDPRGYIYQAAMPVYAQAIGSMAPEFFRQGELLNPQKGLAADIYSFRIKGERENQLILARKLGKKYLIYGSIMPNSNVKGNIPQKENVNIPLDGMDLTLELRRQGSMYVLDMSKEVPIFYQLDGWHQYEHPYYWEKAIKIEAENASYCTGEFKLKTYLNNGDFDFTNYKTVIQLNERNSASFELPNISTAKTLIIKLKNTSIGPTSLQIAFNDKRITKTVESKHRDYILELSKKESALLFDSEIGKGSLKLQVKKGEVEVDNLIIE